MKNLLCHLRWHKWSKRVNDSGESYLVCVRCRKHDDNAHSAVPLGWN